MLPQGDGALFMRRMPHVSARMVELLQEFCERELAQKS